MVMSLIHKMNDFFLDFQNLSRKAFRNVKAYLIFIIDVCLLKVDQLLILCISLFPFLILKI